MLPARKSQDAATLASAANNNSDLTVHEPTRIEGWNLEPSTSESRLLHDLIQDLAVERASIDAAAVLVTTGLLTDIYDSPRTASGDVDVTWVAGYVFQLEGGQTMVLVPHCENGVCRSELSVLTRGVCLPGDVAQVLIEFMAAMEA